jgi:hypothetical protein
MSERMLRQQGQKIEGLFRPRCVISDKPQRTARIPEPIVGA